MLMAPSPPLFSTQNNPIKRPDFTSVTYQSVSSHFNAAALESELTDHRKQTEAAY